MGKRARAVVLAVAIPMYSIGAQPHSAIAGLVRDSSGAPVRGALVTIALLNLEARTDSLGAFQFARVPTGEASLLVRRMGYAPDTIQHLVTGNAVDSLSFRLSAVPLELSPVIVSERERRRSLHIDEFYRRRERGQGHYITREEIEGRHTSRLSDVVRSVPGVRLVRTRGGFGLRFQSAPSIRLGCAPMIWVDGQRAPGMELDELGAMEVEGIELYSGPSQTPMRFSQGNQSTCGTVVIWSRVPGT